MTPHPFWNPRETRRDVAGYARRQLPTEPGTLAVVTGDPLESGVVPTFPTRGPFVWREAEVTDFGGTDEPAFATRENTAVVPSQWPAVSVGDQVLIFPQPTNGQNAWLAIPRPQAVGDPPCIGCGWTAALDAACCLRLVVTEVLGRCGCIDDEQVLDFEYSVPDSGWVSTTDFLFCDGSSDPLTFQRPSGGLNPRLFSAGYEFTFECCTNDTVTFAGGLAACDPSTPTGCLDPVSNVFRVRLQARPCSGSGSGSGIGSGVGSVSPPPPPPPVQTACCPDPLPGRFVAQITNVVLTPDEGGDCFTIGCALIATPFNCDAVPSPAPELDQIWSSFTVGGYAMGCGLPNPGYAPQLRCVASAPGLHQWYFQGLPGIASVVSESCDPPVVVFDVSGHDVFPGCTFSYRITFIGV